MSAGARERAGLACPCTLVMIPYLRRLPMSWRTQPGFVRMLSAMRWLVSFLEGTKYEGEYAKVSEYLSTHREKKILFLELGVGRLTPMFIQEPFWYLTLNLPQTSYISVNNRYNYMPVEIEDRGMVILDDIGRVLADAARLKTTGSLSVASGTNGEDNG